jgi:hypothetical protein
MYFFAFFLIYMEGLYNLLTHTRLFTKAEVTILGQVQKVIVPNYNEFLVTFEHFNTTDSLSVLNTEMMCKIDNKSTF